MTRARFCRLLLLALATFVFLGCDNRQALHTPEPGLERMLQQRRADPYGGSSVFADGRSMRSPPPGTVARGRDHVGDRVIATGQDENEDAKRVPLPLTRALLENGRARFDEICATCHGVLGDGVSVVAEKMRLRKPPSLFEARISQQAPGRVFRTISQGFGLMPSYAAALSIDERWAVVAYIEALRLSQAAPVAELSPALRAELARRAP